MTDVTTTVLVLDGEQRAALAAVRSLGKGGFRLHVGSASRRCIAGGSRFAASETLLPDPLAGAEAYCRAVARLAAQTGAELVFPMTEASTMALLERPELLPSIRIPTSDLAHFRRAADKAEVLALAASIGIAVPEQWIVEAGGRTLPQIPPGQFPVVVKPSRSVVGREGERRKVGVAYAETAKRLDEVVAELGSEAGPLLIQSKIEGAGLGVFMLRWGGEVLATFAHRRIREKPPSGGVSVYSESVLAPPELVDQSAALLAALDWTGVAMIEYKVDRRSGRAYLMEVNPRFWGSLQLAIDAGVDFPRYLARVALGERISPIRSWKVGVRVRWRWGEIDHLIARLRRSKAELDLPRDAPGRLRTALATLSPWLPGARSEVFRWSDPVPSFRETIAWIQGL